MVNWKEYPNLFWNGKFRFIHEGVLIPNDSFSSLDLTDHGETPTDICIERQNDTPKWVDVRNCLLLARKIESMGNVEVAKTLKHQNIKHEGRDFGYYKSWLIDVVNENYEEQEGYGDILEKLSANAQNYLLSIGVYPFSQLHFEDETVIDINSIE